MNILKTKLYFIGLNLKVNKGLKNATIVPFEQDLYDRLDNVYFCGANASIWLKYLKPMNYMNGQCMDRSLFILSGLSKATLIKADLNQLELLYGKENSYHFFVQYNGWIYDPTTLFKFRTDVYFDMFKPSNIQYFSSEEYKTWAIYKSIMDTSLDDLENDTFKKSLFYIGIQQTKSLVDISNDENFKKEFNVMLERINYKPFNLNDDVVDLIKKMCS